MTLTVSTVVPRRQAASTPVSVPITIEKTVPSEHHRDRVLIADSRLLETGCSFANETPRLPWASCFR